MAGSAAAMATAGRAAGLRASEVAEEKLCCDSWGWGCSTAGDGLVLHGKPCLFGSTTFSS